MYIPSLRTTKNIICQSQQKYHLSGAWISTISFLGWASAHARLQKNCRFMLRIYVPLWLQNVKDQTCWPSTWDPGWCHYKYLVFSKGIARTVNVLTTMLPHLTRDAARPESCHWQIIIYCSYQDSFTYMYVFTFVHGAKVTLAEQFTENNLISPNEP